MGNSSAGSGTAVHTKSIKKSINKIISTLAVSLLTMLMLDAAYANPEGGQVTAGSATVSQTPGNTQINQSSDKAIINWNSFNISQGEKTQFIQPSSSSVTLNRIDPSQGGSQIFGQLSANGRVILVNQAGIYFGPTAYVNVGGIIASTRGITDQNFLAGKYVFDQTSSNYNGTITNKGTIIAAQNGLVALVGANVSNEGYIQANGGHVVLASGNKFTLDITGDGLLNFTVDEELSQTGVDENGNQMRDGVKNTGTIVADGGKILITAKAASGVVDHVINMQGVAQAKSISQTQNGEIIFSAEGNGEVVIAAKIDASGKGAGQKGGKVKILAQNVKVKAPASIDVSGDVGGGEILIGGNYQGKGPEQNALITIVDSGVQLNANAITKGNGGKVIIWADGYTGFHGDISAQGGVFGGDGGLVETSGHYLNVQGAQISTLASSGKTGTWLLDPSDLTISSSSTTSSITGFVYGNTSSNSILNVSDLTTALASNNIYVQTTNTGSGGNGDILINSDITWSSGTTLNLSAYRHITSTNNITNTGGGSVVLQADNTGTSTGTVSFSATKNVILSGGSGTVSIYYNPATFGTQDSIYTGGTTATKYMLINSLGTATDSATTRSLGALSNNSSLWTKNFALGKDIDASATSGGSWNGALGWSPIGNTYGSGFSGNFDGQGHVISNIYFNRSYAGPTPIGFFGQANGNIRNLGLTNINLNINQTSQPTCCSVVGGLVGYYAAGNTFVMSNVFTTGSITVTGFGNVQAGGAVGNARFGDKINDSYSSVNVSVTTNNSATGQTSAAGFVAQIDLDTAVSRSYATGTVSLTIGTSVSEANAGGFIGQLSSNTGNPSVSDSYSTGSVTVTGAPTSYTFSGVGGFAGHSLVDNSQTTTIQRSYSTGAVSAAGYTSNKGGFIGLNTGTLTNNFFNTTTSGFGSTAGCGNSSSCSGVTGQTTSQMQTKSTFTGAGWDFSSTPVWGMIGSSGYTYPYLNSILQGITGTVYTNSSESTGQGAGVTVAIAANGTVLSSPTVYSSLSTTDASSNYYFLLNKFYYNNAKNPAVVYNTSGTVGNSVAWLSTAALNAATINIDGNTILGYSNQSNLSNSLLVNAGTSALSANILYTGSGVAPSATLTLNNNIALKTINATVGGTSYTTNYTIDGAITASGASGTLTFSGPLTVKNNNATVTSAALQTYSGAVTLSSDATFNAGSGGITFGSTINGAQALSISNGSGALSFSGAIGGSTALTSLTVGTSDATTLNSNITTTGAQTYNSAVTLGATTTLTSNSSGAINFASTLGGAFGLTVNTSGTTTFGATVNGLSSLTTDAGGSTLLNADVTTTDSQIYNDPISITATRTLTASSGTGDIQLLGALTWTGSNTLTLSAGRNLFLNTDISNASGSLVLSASNGASSLVTGTIGHNTAGSVTSYTNNINVSNFTLSRGQWLQNAATAPGLFPTFVVANNFQIGTSAATYNNRYSAQFTRLSTASSNNGIFDVYGLQGASTGLLNTSYFLSNNINAAGTSNWNSGVGFVPIGIAGVAYTGTFNGQNNVIDGLYFNVGSTYLSGDLGLFSLLSGTVTNVGLSNVNITIVETDYNYNHNVGALVGTTSGTANITNSYASGTINATDNCSGGCLTVGGLVGITQSNTLISNSFSNVAITAAMNNSSGSSIVGGLLGTNNSSANPGVTNSYNLGPLVITSTGGGNHYAGGLIGYNANGVNSNSYNAGYMSTGAGVTSGGAIALNIGGSNTNLYWDTQTSGKASSAAGTGQTTANMMAQATFTGWTFDASNWGIIEGNGTTASGSYPYLRTYYTSTPRVISGLSPTSTTANSTVKLVTGSSVFDTAYTGSNGFYYFLETNGAIADNTPFLVYLNGSNKVANVIGQTQASGASSVLLNMTDKQIDIYGNTTALTNTNLGTLATPVTTADILYSVSTGNLTLGNATNTTANFVTNTSTVNTGTLSSIASSYTLDGNVARGNGGNATTNLTFGGPLTISGTSIVTSGAQLYNGAVTLGATTAFTSNSSGAINFASTLNGAFGLTVSTAGATTFGGVVGGLSALASITTDLAGSTAINTTGVTTTGAQVYNDILSLGANTTLTSNSSGAINFANTFNGAFTLTVNTTGITTFSAIVGGSSALASITTDSPGTTVFGTTGISTSGAQTYNDNLQFTAAPTLNATVITLGATTTNTISNGSNTLTINNSSTSNINAALNGSGGLIKSGNSTLFLNNTNSYDGATTINAGTLAVIANNGLGTTAAGTTIASGATLDLQNINYSTAESITNNGGTISTSTGTSSFAGNVALGANSNFNIGGTQLTSSGIISDGGSGFGITKLGVGTLILNNNSNNYSGNTNVNVGTLLISTANSVPSTSTLSIASGATFGFDGLDITLSGLTGSGNLAVQNATLTINNSSSNTYNGTLSGNGNLIKSGAGLLTFNTPSTFTGMTTINNGTLQAGIADAFANSSSISIGTGAIFDLNGFNNTLASIAGSGNISLGGGTLTAGNTSSTTFSGVMSGSGSFIKTGTGTLTFSNANTFDGTTSINAGTIIASNANSLGSTVGGTTIASGAQLTINNANIGAESVALNGGTIQGNSASLAGNITLGGASILSSSNTFTLSGTINGASGLTLSGDNIIMAGIIGGSTPLSSLTSNATSTTLNNNVATSGSQTYNNAVSFGGNATLSVASGSLTFLSSLTGNGNSLTLSSANSSNGLTIGNSNSQNWNISGPNTGMINGVLGSGSLSFNGFGNITSGSGNDSFAFNNGASVNSLNGGLGTNTLSYSYSTPLTITMSGQFDGQVTNSNNSLISSYQNIGSISGVPTLRTAANKTNVVYITGSNSGYVNDPFYFTGVSTLQAQGNTQIIFTSSAQVSGSSSNSITVNVGGIQMEFTNVSLENLSGDLSVPLTISLDSSTINALLSQITFAGYVGATTNQSESQSSSSDDSSDGNSSHQQSPSTVVAQDTTQMKKTQQDLDASHQQSQAFSGGCGQ